MEELRSTEILDKEIYSDARKKAERILSKADVDCKLLLSDVDNRIAGARKEISEKNAEKINKFERDQNASLPLEKERFLVDFIQKSINKATDEFLDSLSEEERIEIVLMPLNKLKDVFDSKEVNVSYYGFDEKLVKKSLEKKLNVKSYSRTDFNKIIVENDCGITNQKGLVVESCDKSVRVRFTLSEIISQIQDKYRVELYDALFAGKLSLAGGF